MMPSLSDRRPSLNPMVLLAVARSMKSRIEKRIPEALPPREVARLPKAITLITTRLVSKLRSMLIEWRSWTNRSHQFILDLTYHLLVWQDQNRPWNRAIDLPRCLKLAMKSPLRAHTAPCLQGTQNPKDPKPELVRANPVVPVAGTKSPGPQAEPRVNQVPHALDHIADTAAKATVKSTTHIPLAPKILRLPSPRMIWALIPQPRPRNTFKEQGKFLSIHLGSILDAVAKKAAEVTAAAKQAVAHRLLHSTVASK